MSASSVLYTVAKLIVGMLDWSRSNIFCAVGCVGSPARARTIATRWGVSFRPAARTPLARPARSCTVAGMSEDVDKLRETLATLRGEHDAAVLRADRQRSELDLKIAALARKFEESLDRLTDNRELISGIKAFLRMVRDPAPLSTGPAAGSPSE